MKTRVCRRGTAGREKPGPPLVLLVGQASCPAARSRRRLDERPVPPMYIPATRRQGEPAGDGSQHGVPPGPDSAIGSGMVKFAHRPQRPFVCVPLPEFRPVRAGPSPLRHAEARGRNADEWGVSAKRQGRGAQPERFSKIEEIGEVRSLCGRVRHVTIRAPWRHPRGSSPGRRTRCRNDSRTRPRVQEVIAQRSRAKAAFSPHGEDGR